MSKELKPEAVKHFELPVAFEFTKETKGALRYDELFEGTEAKQGLVGGLYLRKDRLDPRIVANPPRNVSIIVTIDL